MRPVPSSKHVLSVSVFLLVAFISGYFAWWDNRLADEQISFATAAAKRNQPELMQYDSVYGQVYAEGRLRQVHTPVFLAMMDMVLIPTGYEDLTLPFRLMTGPLVFVFLCGMYALLWRQCRSSTISAFVAVLSTTVLHTFGNWYWGIGSLASVTPQGVVIALSPLIVLSYLQNAHRNQVLLTFASIGLLANVHLIAAVNLCLILLIVHLGRNRCSVRSLMVAGTSAIAFLLGAAPYLLYFFALRASVAAQAAPDAATNPQAVFEALRISDLVVLYPEMLGPLLQWAPYALGLLVIAGVMLWRFERFRAHNLDIWLWMAGAAVFVGLGLHGLSQLYGMLTDRPPPIIDFVQAASWAMLPLYVLLGQSVTHVFRLVRRPKMLQWIFALFLIAWMLPSDNLRMFRHAIYYSTTAILPEGEQPVRVRELEARREQLRELRAMADWARQNSADDAVFIADCRFRMLSRRSALVCREDIRNFYYLAPWLLDDWTDLIVRQTRCLSDPIDARRLAAQVRRLARQERYAGAGTWYVLLEVHPTRDDLQPLEEITPMGWGTHWRMYQIPMPEQENTVPP